MKIDLSNIKTFVILHHKTLIIIAASLIGFFSLKTSVQNIGTKTAYYIHKDSYKVIKTRIKINKLENESDIQAYLRNYLSGSTKYIVKIPFIAESQLLSVSHDKKKKILVLNWNSYFYRALDNDSGIEKEIEVLLLSIRKNFNIEIVYFLIEGTVVTWKWRDMSLGEGINLEIFKKKFKKD